MSVHVDGGTGPDLAGRDLAGHDLSSPPDLSSGTGLPCTPGSYRCGAGNSVEVCNSTGTAWLHTATCAVSCMAGLCTGACTPGTRRCNVKDVEECNAGGTTWGKVESCSGSCSAGKCALLSLDITMNQNLDGEIFVDGDVLVHSGVSVTSPSGDLTLHAKNIKVENMATITAAARGNPWGWGNGGTSGSGSPSYCGGGGGSNGSRGTNDLNNCQGPGGVIGVDNDVWVYGGGSGGSGTPSYGGSGGAGGGAIRLIASQDITIAGFVTANGNGGGAAVRTNGSGGGGGGGGGILLAAGGTLTLSGVVSAAGGAAGGGTYSGGAGGNGRVKILAGDKRMITGTVNGTRTEGLLPPMVITSSSHPDCNFIYNDDFDSVEMSWVSPFASRQGYYQMINTSNWQVPTPATATFINTESKSYPANALKTGSNWFHIIPVDALSNLGTVEMQFCFQINATPPTVSSVSHPAGTWTDKPDVFLSWTLPLSDSMVQGIYYDFDRYGDTVPTKASTFQPVGKKNQLLSGIMPGIWVMHVVAMDQRGYLTKAAGHYRVQVGTDPGNGVVLGQVTDSMGKPLSGAQVSINRGLWSQNTNSSGNYNFPTVSGGNYELRVSYPGKTPMTQMIKVTMGMSTTANVSFP